MFTREQKHAEESSAPTQPSISSRSEAAELRNTRRLQRHRTAAQQRVFRWSFIKIHRRSFLPPEVSQSEPQTRAQWDHGSCCLCDSDEVFPVFFTWSFVLFSDTLKEPVGTCENTNRHNADKLHSRVSLSCFSSAQVTIHV